MKEILVKLSKRVLLVLFFTFLVVTVGMIPAKDVSSLAQASSAQTALSNSLYSWGANERAQLGIPTDSSWQFIPWGTPNHSPWTTIVDAPTLADSDANNWIALSAGHGHSLGLNEAGEVYAWGSNTYGQLGLGEGIAYAASPMKVSFPEGVEDSGWVFVYAEGPISYAINDHGELWGWGVSMQHAFGSDHNFSGLNNLYRPFRLGTKSNWLSVDASFGSTVYLNSDGEIFHIAGASPQVQEHPVGFEDVLMPIPSDKKWTSVASYASSVYAGISSEDELYLIHWQGGSDFEFTRLGAQSNWTIVEGSVYGALYAINDKGELWTLGGGFPHLDEEGVDGQLIRYPNTDSKWVSVSAGDRHMLAINSEGELFAFGGNHEGQLGHPVKALLCPDSEATGEEITSSDRLIKVQSDEVIRWTHVAAGFSHSLALGIRVDQLPQPEPATLTKVLRLPQGVTFPEGISFEFAFEPLQLEGIATAANLASTPAIANQTLALDATNLVPSSSGSSIVVATASLDVRAVLDDIDFPHAGIFAWTVAEVEGGSQTTGLASVNYSRASFELRVYVRNATDDFGSSFEVVAIEVFERHNTQGEEVPDGQKQDYLTFVNGYTTQAQDLTQGALSISKELRGDFANIAQKFDFILTLQPPALGTFPLMVEAQIVDSAGTLLDTVKLGLGTNFFSLAHNQRLLIPTLPAGTTFQVTELATDDFSPSALVTTGGQARRSYTEVAGQKLATTSHVIYDAGRNAADFTNTHKFSIPTGLVLAYLPHVTLLSLALLTYIIAGRRRKTIEELPLTFC